MTTALATTTPTGMTVEGETAAFAVAAQAKAAIEARWLVAKAQPRNIEAVRQELLKECQRPSFAAAARYKKPIGQGIEGLSIRFVEATLQCMGNVDCESITIFDTDLKRIVEVRVTDFQKNICHRKQITIDKTVERRKLRDGQHAIGTRKNSNGQQLYIVKASEDDLLNKEGALISKAIRTCGLRIIPGWLQDEATEIIKLTVADAAARDPDAEQRKLTDAFGQLGITPPDLEEYMNHSMAQIVPAELVDLRAIYSAIYNGEATWVDTLDHRKEMRGDSKREMAMAKPAAEAPKGTTGTSKAMAAISKNSAAKEAAKTPDHGVNQPAKSTEPTPEPAKSQAITGDGNKQSGGDIVAPVSTAAKKPSRSKAAIEERRKEIYAMGIKTGKYGNLYVQHGDPRNLAKATTIHAEAKAKEAEDRQAAEMESAGEEVAAEAEARTTTNEDGTEYDSKTGEVVDEGPQDEGEPAWMSEGDEPPAGEGF